MIDWIWFFFFFLRCEYVEIDERHALEIDNPMQLFLANILSTIPEW